jgi:hypothetical protein
VASAAENGRNPQLKLGGNMAQKDKNPSDANVELTPWDS